ncbi:MAG: HlyD family type I secretion periplasmic adaptor subunit [Desulfovibrio sp.]|nr:HlyD family type I secretion periplasmic adaptor subunit [Desulfovibrio sp.]
MPDDKKPIETTATHPIAKINPIRMLASEPGRKKKPQENLPDIPDLPESPGIESPKHIVRQGLWLILIFFGIFGIWSFFGHISGAVVAPGTIKIENERKIVQHLEGGIVEDILVREGEEVKAGQPLVVLESVSVDANTNITRKQALDLEARRTRLIAEKDHLDRLEWTQGVRDQANELNALDVLSNEEKVFATRRNTLNNQVELLKTQLAQLKAQERGLEDQLKAEGAILSALREELSAKRQLYKERYLEKSQILALEREVAGHQGSQGRLRQSIAESRQKAAELNLRIEDVTGRFVEDATRELTQVENELTQARERIRPLADAKKRLQITAPVAGKVVDLKIHSRGGVVHPGETLMDIVPHDNPLIIETQVPVNKITEVYVGQPAMVQLDAFDTNLIPHMPGKVTYVSADRLEQPSYGGNMPYYLCYVEVDPAALKENDLYLSPGMPATVFITTTEKTVIYSIFEPII